MESKGRLWQQTIQMRMAAHGLIKVVTEEMRPKSPAKTQLLPGGTFPPEKCNSHLPRFTVPHK